MYTQSDLEDGVGCYADRTTFIFTDGLWYFTSDDKNSYFEGCWFCGSKPANGPISWC